jgi:hypothetical protein
MSKLIANRTLVVIAATFFAIASWANASRETATPAANLTVIQTTPELSTVAHNR